MVKGIESNLERLSSDYREELEQIGISDHEPIPTFPFHSDRHPALYANWRICPDATPREISTGRSLNLASVSAGGRHTCGVRLDGSITCWGKDEYGQSTPPAGEFTSVSAGFNHTCGVRLDGSVSCWGLGSDRSSPPAGESRPSARDTITRAACGLTIRSRAGVAG